MKTFQKLQDVIYKYLTQDNFRTGYLELGTYISDGSVYQFNNKTPSRWSYTPDGYQPHLNDYAIPHNSMV